MERFTRMLQIITKEQLEKMSFSHVIVFGLGGVGSYVVETLVRAGLGEITIVDHDIIEKSNLNRQLFALESTIGQKKVDVAEKRILDINPLVKVHKLTTFALPETIESFSIDKYDFVVDAIDTVSGKLAIIKEAKKFNINIISAMGTGNKLDPSKLIITDISKTAYCPLAKVMRTELRKSGINKLPVIYSTEQLITENHHIVGSTSFVPSTAGIMIAAYVFKTLINEDYNE